MRNSPPFFLAGADTGYDYQWYIFSGAEGIRELNKTERRLEKEPDIVVEKQYTPLPGIGGLKVRRK